MISLVMCSTKKCPRPAEAYVVSKTGGMSEVHLQMCPECEAEKGPKFLAQGWNVVKLTVPPAEMG